MSHPTNGQYVNPDDVSTDEDIAVYSPPRPTRTLEEPTALVAASVEPEQVRVHVTPMTRTAPLEEPVDEVIASKKQKIDFVEAGYSLVNKFWKEHGFAPKNAFGIYNQFLAPVTVPISPYTPPADPLQRQLVSVAKYHHWHYYCIEEMQAPLICKVVDFDVQLCNDRKTPEEIVRNTHLQSDHDLACVAERLMYSLEGRSFPRYYLTSEKDSLEYTPEEMARMLQPSILDQRQLDFWDALMDLDK